MEEIELNIYKGEWGLPSVDLDCIRIITYMKLSGAPVILNKSPNPIRSPNGFLPYISEKNKKISDYDNIVKYLNSQNYDVNRDLTEEQRCLSDAYMHYIFSKLHLYFHYTLWGDPNNVQKCHSLYGKRIPFPFSFYSPHKYVTRTENIVSAWTDFSLEDKIIDHDIDSFVIDAKKFINAISAKLGDKQWVFGDKPSEFDATLYGYISILFHISLVNNPLQAHIKECPNLVAYIRRLTKTYFIQEAFNSQTTESTSNKSNEEDYSLSNGKTQILAGIVAGVAMLTYAVTVGIIHITRDVDYSGQFIDDDEEEGDSGGDI